MSKQLIALKLGSTTTTIYKQGEGLVLKEPSLIAVQGTLKSREIKAIGKDAKRLQGRTSGNISVVSPINASVITDSDLATAMLKGFLKRIFPRKFLQPKIKAILCVPLGISVAEKKAFEKVCYNAGIADVSLIPAVICSAIGDNIPINTSNGKLIVNIGGGTTNIAAMANNSIITGVNVTVGGTNINKAMEKFILENHNLVVSETVAEHVKKEICSLLENDIVTIEVQGVNVNTKEPSSIILSSKEVYPITIHYYTKIAEAISSVLSSCPPDIVADISKEGMYVFGGDSQINGIHKFFKSKLGINVNLSENAKTDILGAAKILDYPTEYSDVLKSI